MHSRVSLLLLRLHEVVCLGSWQQDFDNPSHPLLAAFQVPSRSLKQLKVQVHHYIGLMEHDTRSIIEVQKQLNKLLVRHKTLELERQQLLDRRQHDVVACFLSMRISNEVGYI